MSGPPAMPSPLLQPLGDRALLVRFATTLSEAANTAAIAFARRLQAAPPEGVGEVVPNLVSVLLTYDPRRVTYARLAGEVRLLANALPAQIERGARHVVAATFDGPDLGEVAATLGMSTETFIAAHGRVTLRVLATGFAPGFVYCGFHDEAMALPRRTAVRPEVPAGTLLFAARQTAVASTPIPTGWHVIGHTDFRNFHPQSDPPTTLRAGDTVVFEAVR